MTNAADSAGNPGFFKRLRTKLSAGSSWLTQGLKELLPGRKIDAEILEELETRLISADVGAAATGRILDDLHKRAARKELDTSRRCSKPCGNPCCRSWSPSSSHS